MTSEAPSMTNETCPNDLLYTSDHEWARLEESDGQTIATVGITRFAVDQLGDVTQVELPKEGESTKQGAIFGSVESVKAVSDLFAPLSGRIVGVNVALRDSPEHVNSAPYADGWMVRIALTSPDETRNLMTATGYRELLHRNAE
jgi:glycine cleavage system H protein